MKKDFKEDIDNKNDKFEWHGYNEWYFNDTYLVRNDTYLVRANFKNNNKIGYAESHYYKHTSYYIR